MFDPVGYLPTFLRRHRLACALRVRSPFLAYPHAGALAPSYNASHSLPALFVGQAESHPFHRFAYVVRRESIKDLRGVECARSVAGAQGEELHPQLLGALAPVQAPQLAHTHITVAFRLPGIRARDLGFDQEVRGGAFEIGIGRRPLLP